jgi:hypothetical protein
MSETTDEDKLVVEAVLLELMKVTGEAAIPDGFRSRMKLDVYYEQAKWLVMRLTAYVATQNVEEVFVEYPADWKEAVKEYWLPRLYRSRWIPRFIWRWARGKPVRYERVALRAKRVYPNMVIPRQRHCIHLLKEYVK